MTAENLHVDLNLRNKILSEPEIILDDPDVMRALVSAQDRIVGDNVVDMRTIAMRRLEGRLDRLEETNRSVIAAAYDNLTGTKQIHRAALKVLEPLDFSDFLTALKGDISEALGVDFLKLVLEMGSAAPAPVLDEYSDILIPAPAGFIMSYLQSTRSRTSAKVILRQVQPNDDLIYGEQAGFVQSEACLKLDLGPGTMPALLVLGSDSPHQFSPSQGTDLLEFFASVFEKTMRRWLA